MKPVPLQLDDYIVTDYSYKLNLGAMQPKPDNLLVSQVDVDFDVNPHKTEENQYIMSMVIHVNKKPSFSKRSRYQIYMRLLGRFRFQGGIDKPEKARLIYNNGSAILYGVARGTIGEFTSGLGVGRYILPVINLLAVAKQKLKKSRPGRKTK